MTRALPVAWVRMIPRKMPLLQAEHPALRWLGPHNGVLHLALASIANACFDLWAKARGQVNDPLSSNLATPTAHTTRHTSGPRLT